MIREVWAEFQDGSVARYDVRDEELPDLVNKLLGEEVCLRVWVDGQLRMKPDRSECMDSIELTVGPEN